MRKNLNNGLIHAMNAFVRVVDAGSFTAAAEQLHLTVAQTSRLVTGLEKRLRIRLLQRTTRSLTLTDAGQNYLEKCRHILDLIAEAEGDAHGVALQPSGRLRILSMTGFGSRYISPLIPEYCAHYPNVTIEYGTSQLVPALSAEGVDVSVYPSQRLPDSRLITQKLGNTFAVMCASRGYISKAGMPTHPRELVSHACLRLVNPSVTPQWELIHARLGIRHAKQPTGPVISDTPDVLLQSAINDAGITLLPSYMVIDSIRKGELLRVLPQWRSSEIGVFLLIGSRRFVDAKTSTWIQFVKDRIPAALLQDCDFRVPVSGRRRSLRTPNK
jgi:DNA-binding transcriptional LysR family regulator